VEESQLKLRRSGRLASQPPLSPEPRVVRTKRTRWTRSKSPFKVRTEVPTTSEILVTPNISGIPASIEEVQQQQKDSCTDPSLKTSTCITEPVPSETGPQSLVVQTTVAVEATPSSAPEIFYGPDGLPLPPGLIAIEEIVEDQQANTPIHFGVGTTLFPSASEVCPSPLEVPEESLGSLLDRLKMSEQPSTSRTVPNDTATAEAPAANPTMFAGIPAVPTSSHQLEGVHPGTIMTTWSVPVCSSGIIPGNSYVETRQIDPFGNQFGPSSPQRPSIPLSSGLLPYGGQYALSLPLPGGYPYGSFQPHSGLTEVTTSGWVPMLPQQPRVVYSMQQCVPMSSIPTTPAIVTVSQVQSMPVVCQPQVVMQQPIDPATQPQSPTAGTTQIQTGTITPHLGPSVSVAQQNMASQPWMVQYQQPQFQQVYQGSEQQIFANSGQPYIQNGLNQPLYSGQAHQPYQSYQHQLHYAGVQRPTAQAIPSYPGYASPNLNQQLPFVATLELPDLHRLTNDPIAYAHWWPAIPHKLPSDIPKFNGNPGEDPSNHVMTFHLWCSSNTLNDDSIRLRLFQRTLTGPAAKWYIELPRASFDNFSSLATTFLTHFQLPIRYETGTEILTNFKQTTATHISDHIHEWRRRRRMVKTYVPDQLLAEWFIKSLLPAITEDVAKGGVVTEEQVIARAQYLDLVYTQSGTLYDKIPDAPRPEFSIPPPPGSNSDSHAGDGVIGTANAKSTRDSNKKARKTSNQKANQEILASEVNAVSTDKDKNSNQPGSKKKQNKGKKKKQGGSSPQKTSSNPPGQRKQFPPCQICDENHSTKNCPFKAELKRFFKSSQTSAVLTDPFPAPGQNMVDSGNASPSQVLMLSVSKQNDALISTRNKDYGNPPVSNDKGKDQPSSSTTTSAEVVPPLTHELTIKPPKGVVHKSTFNPRARAAQHYNIVEDLAQSPSAMSTLEVLQNCPSQRQALLSAIGGVDPKDSNLVSFDHKGYDPQLPAQLAFLIQVKALNKTVHRTIIDEGASTCIMSMSCWKTLGSPTLSRSSTTLKAFDGRSYTPYGILNNFKVELGGKTVEIDVEVIDGNLDYNILLGRPWIYAMAAVVSTYFRKIAFPFEGGITIVDQQNFLPNGSQVTGSIPLIHGSDHSIKDIGVGLLKDPTMMGTFALPPPFHDSGYPVCSNMQHGIFIEGRRRQSRHGSSSGIAT
jgi:hypothetical protein